MSRELFDDVKVGQPITASRTNREAQVLNRLARFQGGIGLVGRHSGYSISMRTRPPWDQGIVTITESLGSGIYLGTKRRYNFNQAEWRDRQREWQVDANGLDTTLNVGDRLVVYWDAQRGMLVPSAPPFGGVGFMLAEDHPGRGLLFEVWLGTWDSATHSWDYDGSVTYQCIDWRYDVPYPEICATGLGFWMPSDEYGKIIEVWSLDCSSPGCESSSSITSFSASSASSSSSF